MPETIDAYETATVDDRDFEEIVGGASAGKGQIPYQVKASIDTSASTQERSAFMFYDDYEETSIQSGGANFLMGDGAVIFITDSVDPGNIYPDLDPDREDPGSLAGDEGMPPQDWDLAI